MLQKILVQCYAGNRADESPRRVIIEGRAHTVARLISQSIEESLDKREVSHRYHVLTDEGLLLEIIRTGDEWFLISQKGGYRNDE